MPCISGSYNPNVGPLIQVAVFSASKELLSGKIPKTLEVRTYNALIDTGATNTCLSDKVVKELNLQPRGKTTMSGATGTKPVDQFSVCIGFLLSRKQEPTGKDAFDIAALQPVQACQFSNSGFAFDLLLGRDIICKGSFSMSFDGHFILSF